MFSIRTTYPDRICYRPDGVSLDSMAACVLLGNPDGVDPDSLAHSVSSGRGVPTPCTCRRSPLRSIAQSTRGRIPYADILHPDISHPNGRGGRFNFSGQTYPDPLVALTQSDMHSCTVLLKLLDFPTDILRYFEIFCFRYLLSKSPNSPFNSPIIGFLSS